MTDPNELAVLEATDEAEWLWKGAVAALERGTQDPVSLSTALDLGLRTAEVLAFEKLQVVRDRFPATIGALLLAPPPEIDVRRDAVETPRVLRFSDVLDLLSEESLDCVGPDLHHGWEDRRFSCRRSRATAQEAIGVRLGGEERGVLLALSACRNRIFRVPPPVRWQPGEIRAAFPTLVSLVERLRL